MAGTVNCLLVNAPPAVVGPKRLSKAVLLTTVVPMVRVMLAEALKPVPLMSITVPATPVLALIAEIIGEAVTVKVVAVDRPTP